MQTIDEEIDELEKTLADLKRRREAEQFDAACVKVINEIKDARARSQTLEARKLQLKRALQSFSAWL